MAPPARPPATSSGPTVTSPPGGGISCPTRLRRPSPARSGDERLSLNKQRSPLAALNNTHREALPQRLLPPVGAAANARDHAPYHATTRGGPRWPLRGHP